MDTLLKCAVKLSPGVNPNDSATYSFRMNSAVMSFLISSIVRAISHQLTTKSTSIPIYPIPP